MRRWTDEKVVEAVSILSKIQKERGDFIAKLVSTLDYTVELHNCFFLSVNPGENTKTGNIQEVDYWENNLTKIKSH